MKSGDYTQNPGLRGAPKWLIFIAEIASVPLLVIGFFAVAAV